MNFSIFVVQLHYRDRDQIARHHAAHVEWCEKHAAAGTFLLAGPTSAVDGAVFLAHRISHDALVALMHEDPFYQAGLVTFEIVEIVPRRGALRRSPENPLYLPAEERQGASMRLAPSEPR
jgi:uncharacterized protein YciI